MPRFPEIDDLIGLDTIHAAVNHIRKQFRMDMTREEAKANLDSRSILFHCANKILHECGEGITYEEVQGALILEAVTRTPQADEEEK